MLFLYHCGAHLLFEHVLWFLDTRCRRWKSDFSWLSRRLKNYLLIIIFYIVVFCSVIPRNLYIFGVSMYYPLCILFSQIANCEALSQKGSLRRIKNCFSWPCCCWHPNTTKPRSMKLSLTHNKWCFWDSNFRNFFEIL